MLLRSRSKKQRGSFSAYLKLPKLVCAEVTDFLPLKERGRLARVLVGSEDAEAEGVEDMVARSILRDSASIVVDNATELASFEQWHDTRRSMTNVINMASVPPINMAGVPPKRRKPLFEPKIMMISSVKQSFEAMTELGIYALGGQNQEAVARGFCNCEVPEEEMKQVEEMDGEMGMVHGSLHAAYKKGYVVLAEPGYEDGIICECCYEGPNSDEFFVAFGNEALIAHNTNSIPDDEDDDDIDEIGDIEGLLSLKNDILACFRKNGLKATWSEFDPFYAEYDYSSLLVPKIRIKLAPPEGEEGYHWQWSDCF